MKYTIEVTKRELDLLLRGMRDLLGDENRRSMNRRGQKFAPTKNYLAAEALENRLIKLFAGAVQAEEVQ